MEQEKIVTVNWYAKVFDKKAKPYFEKCYLTGLHGIGLIHANNIICEYPAHCIVVYLGSEHGDLKKIDELRAEVSFGNVSIIPARTDDWEKIESEVIILSIEPDLLNRIAWEKTQASSVKLKPIFAQPDVLIQSITSNIKVELDSPKSDRLYIESLFQALLMHLIKHYCIKEYTPKQITTGGLPPYKLKQAINYINLHLDGNIKIKDVATLIGISQYYFCRLFRESTGISPYRYVIQQRISKVKALIKENCLSLSDIAIECGFSSQSQMTYHFRKLVGITPKVYRVKSCR